MDYIWRYASPLGDMTLASDGAALTGLRFEGQKAYGAARMAEQTAHELPVFSQTARWLDLYFAGEIPDFTPPLRPCGTEFQQSVWEILQTIPYGETAAYGGIAALLAKRRGRIVAAQAVGGAVGKNPIAIIIPCHRVIGANGSLTGYAAGLEKKEKLLALECKK